MEHAASGAAVEMRDRVADRVVLQVAHVGLARGVRQHLEHVRAVDSIDLVVGDLPRALAFPDLLPLGLDDARVVAVLGCHCGRRLAAGRSVARGRAIPSEMRTSVRIVSESTTRVPSPKRPSPPPPLSLGSSSSSVPRGSPLRPGDRQRVAAAPSPVQMGTTARCRDRGDLATCRYTPRDGYVRTKYTSADVDGVAVYCHDLDRCYYLPIESVAGRSSIHLRVATGRKPPADRDKLRRPVPIRGYSSAGRARDWQPRGRRFEPG